MTITECQKEMIMYKNKAPNGKNNISGSNIKTLRENLPNKPSQKQFADMLQIAGLDLDKNAIQRIESGERFVTDIELKVIADVLQTTYDILLS